MTAVGDSSSQTSDASGKALIVISESVNSGNVNTKFRDVTVGVVVMEPYLFDDMELTSSSGYSNGSGSTENRIRIEDSSHPITSGLSWRVTILNSSQTFNQGTPASGSTTLATYYLGWRTHGDAVLFVYDTGSSMDGGFSAPARRVAIWDSVTLSNSNSTGLQIFDAALSWAAGL